MDTSSSTMVYSSSPGDNFFRKRYTATLSFAAGILLFLLPFAELKCSSMTLADNTGIGIALGERWRGVDMGQGNEFMDKINTGIKDGKKDAVEMSPNVFALMALAAAVFGLGFTFTNHKMKAVIGICAGILAAAMLLALMIQLKMLIRSATGTKGVDEPYSLSGILRVQFTVWYYLSLASFAAAAFFSYKHHQIELEDAMANFVDFEFQRKGE